MKAWLILLAVGALSMLSAGQQSGDAANSQAAASPPVNASQEATMDSPCAALSAEDPQVTPLAKVCEFALKFRQNLPDSTCEQTTISTCRQTTVSRCKQTAGSKGPAVQAQVTYLNGKEHYSNVKIDGKPVPGDRVGERRKPYLLTRGEFGSDLVYLFTPPMVVEFKLHRETTLRANRALVYQFHLAADKNTFWTIYDDRNRSVKPELRGELWIDSQTNRLLRLQVEPVHLPLEFDVESGSTIIDYAEVGLGDAGIFLLPTSSLTDACMREYDVDLLNTTLVCVSNAVTFQNCHKFGARARIVEVH